MNFSISRGGGGGENETHSLVQKTQVGGGLLAPPSLSSLGAALGSPVLPSRLAPV